MIKLKQTVIVEGKYDKINISNFIDANIISTEGFAIFKDKEKMKLIRKIAEKDGIIILTDSDSAGAVIRNHLCCSIAPEFITNVFIPPVVGKEKRKVTASKEGLLGVEGLSEEIILGAIKRAKVTESTKGKEKITTAHLWEAGLSGQENSNKKRLLLQEKLGFPKVMSTSQLLTALNALYTVEDLRKFTEELFNG